MSRLTIRQSVVLAFFGVFTCLLIPSTFAEAADISRMQKGRYLTSWHILGPIPVYQDTVEKRSKESQRAAFETDYLGMASLGRIQTGDSVSVNDTLMVWNKLVAPRKVVDLESEYGEREYVIAYASTEIRVPSSREALLAVGSDDGVKVWLNGELVHQYWGGRSLIPDEDLIPVRLHSGRNRLLLKIQQMEYDWGFSCRFISTAGPAGERASVLLSEIRKTSGVPGMSAAVGRDGEILWADATGFADIEQRVAVTPATKFRVGSVSKPITAAGLGVLFERGQLDLDLPVQRYVPSFPEKRWQITTRLVAGHLAGVRHYRNQEFLSDTLFESVEEGLEIFQSDTLLFRPGTKFSYSSYAWNLVSAVVEGASGEDFLYFMDREVFEPLGMRNTTADWNRDIISDRTEFYEMQRDGSVRNAQYVDNSYKWAGGGFLSTPSDLVQFGMGHLDGGFLAEATVETLWTSQQTIDGNTTGYGIGWFTDEDRQGRRVVGHGGGSVGGTTYFLVIPEERISAAIVSNAPGPTTFDGAWTLAELFVKLPSELLSRSDALPGLEGEYRLITQDNSVDSTADAEPPKSDTLSIHLFGNSGDYYGWVRRGGERGTIHSVTELDSALEILAISPGGYLQNVVLEIGENVNAGFWNQRLIQYKKMTETADKERSTG